MSKEREEPAVQAYQSFLKKDYSGALKHISEVEGIVGGLNKRVHHNRAVTEFMLDDMKNIEKFKKVIAQITGLTFPDIEFKDVSSPVAFYNYAVLLYHMRYYYQCTVILEKLMTFIGNIKDKKLAQQIVLLLMEASLCRRTYDKTLEIAKNHGDLIKSNNDISELFDRLVYRAKLILGQKTNPNLKSESIENLFIIAQQHYLNGDAKEAVNTLAKYKNVNCNYDMKAQGEDIWAAINNDLGIIYLSVKKPYLATKYFQLAVKEHFKAMENDESERLITCRDRPLYVHNLGLALLASNNADGAFECLVEAARHYPNSPRIWLHLAECCVKKCCSDEVQQFTAQRLGSGPHTKVLIAEENKVKYSSSGESFAIPSLSLEFAALCLRNAVSLLPNQETPSDVNAPMIQAPPGPPISWIQRCELKNSVLVLQSYILLQLQDPLSALTSSNELLSQPEISNCHKAWAHIYAAEALINLDRITDVAEHLNPTMIHELVSVLPAQMRDLIGVSVWAKAAVCHILRGDLITARKILLQINSPKILPLQMYLEICSGNIENCHNIIRKLKYGNISNANAT